MTLQELKDKYVKSNHNIVKCSRKAWIECPDPMISSGYCIMSFTHGKVIFDEKICVGCLDGCWDGGEVNYKDLNADDWFYVVGDY